MTELIDDDQNMREYFKNPPNPHPCPLCNGTKHRKRTFKQYDHDMQTKETTQNEHHNPHPHP